MREWVQVRDVLVGVRVRVRVAREAFFGGVGVGRARGSWSALCGIATVHDFEINAQRTYVPPAPFPDARSTEDEELVRREGILGNEALGSAHIPQHPNGRRGKLVGRLGPLR